MLYVLVYDNDHFFRQCLMMFVDEVIVNESGHEVTFMHKMTKKNIQKADLIIYTGDDVDFYSCCQEFKKHKPGRLIRLVKKNNKEERRSCVNDVVLISRKSTLTVLRSLVMQMLNAPVVRRYCKCTSCPAFELNVISPQQFRVVDKMLRGMSVDDIAADMMINKNTVYSHKYNLMGKLKLKNNHELLGFWNNVINNKITLPIT